MKMSNLRNFSKLFFIGIIGLSLTSCQEKVVPQKKTETIYKTLTVEKSNQVLKSGFAATINGPGMVLIDYLAVEESLRGQGIGAMALEDMQKISAMTRAIRDFIFRDFMIYDLLSNDFQANRCYYSA